MGNSKDERTIRIVFGQERVDQDVEQKCMKMHPKEAFDLAYKTVADSEMGLADIDAAFERKAREKGLPVIDCAFAYLAMALNDVKPFSVKIAEEIINYILWRKQKEKTINITIAPIDKAMAKQ